MTVDHFPLADIQIGCCYRSLDGRIRHVEAIEWRGNVRFVSGYSCKEDDATHDRWRGSFGSYLTVFADLTTARVPCTDDAYHARAHERRKPQ